MKKMMIIAAMVSMMLIPAQMEAKNKVNNKAKVEYRNNKKDFGKKEFKKFKDDKRFDNKKNFKKKKAYINRKPNKPAVIVANRPAPRPRPLPPPPAPVKVIYERPANAVAQAISLAALAAIIAN